MNWNYHFRIMVIGLQFMETSITIFIHIITGKIQKEEQLSPPKFARARINKFSFWSRKIILLKFHFIEIIYLIVNVIYMKKKIRGGKKTFVEQAKIIFMITDNLILWTRKNDMKRRFINNKLLFYATFYEATLEFVK